MLESHGDGGVQLSDGRTLGYAEYGAPAGRPIFYFSGGNSSRIEGQWFEDAATRHNVHLIAPDRPGFGRSDFQPGRRFLDWADDVAQLADALQIEDFSVFGLSGGSPHVAAVAHRLAARVRRAAIVSGVTPPEMPNPFVGMWFPVRMIFFLARHLPWMNRMALAQMGSFYADKDQMLKRMKQALPAPDVTLIDQRPEIMEIFSSSAHEAHRQGIDGDAWEWQMYVRPWGFSLSELTLPVGLWYGEVDGNVPLGMGHFMAAQIPGSTLHVVPDGGHFSTINNHIDEILVFLTE